MGCRPEYLGDSMCVLYEMARFKKIVVSSDGKTETLKFAFQLNIINFTIPKSESVIIRINAGPDITYNSLSEAINGLTERFCKANFKLIFQNSKTVVLRFALDGFPIDIVIPNRGPVIITKNADKDETVGDSFFEAIKLFHKKNKIKN